MQPRLGPKHKHKIISHTRLGVGRAGKQSDWRMYWSSREGGAPSQDSWSILQANSLNLWWDLCVFVWGSIPSTLYTLWYTCLCVGACVHVCVVCSHINTTNSSVLWLVRKRQMSVWVKDSQGLEKGGLAVPQHRKPLSSSKKPPPSLSRRFSSSRRAL